jgi:hypothetical protein
MPSEKCRCHKELSVKGDQMTLESCVRKMASLKCHRKITFLFASEQSISTLMQFDRDREFEAYGRMLDDQPSPLEMHLGRVQIQL